MVISRTFLAVFSTIFVYKTMIYISVFCLYLCAIPFKLNYIFVESKDSSRVSLNQDKYKNIWTKAKTILTIQSNGSRSYCS